MERSLDSKPSVRFDVEKVIGISSEGTYQVQWAPAWVSKFHLVGCEHLIQEFLQQQQQFEKESEYHASNEISLPEYPSDTERDSNQTSFINTMEADHIPLDEDIKAESESNDTLSCENYGADEIYVKIEDTTGENEMTDTLAPTFLVGLDSPYSFDSSATSDRFHKTFASTEDIEPFPDINNERAGHYISDSSSENITIDSTIARHPDDIPVMPGTGDPSTNPATNKLNKNYVCYVCKKDCASQSLLQIHFRTHSGKKPYPCTICEKSFARNDTLKKHLRTHSGEKPYQCPTCGLRFARQDVLKDHTRLHTGDKRFTCTYCGKSFLKRPDMVRHMRVHTNERPFPCDICGQAFTMKSSLKGHISSHVKKGEFIVPIVTSLSDREGDT